MSLHTAPENKLFSNTPHDLFTPEYERDIRNLFSKFQILYNNFAQYQNIPVQRKPERVKQGINLFRMYWQNLVKLLLPYIRESEINCQRLFMRYGLLHLSDLSEEDMDGLSIIALHTQQPCLVYYIDEWLYELANGNIPPFSEQGKPDESSSKPEESDAVINLNLLREVVALERVVEKLLALSQSMTTPFLHQKDLLRPLIQQLASRESVQKVVAMIKNIDPGVFSRKLLKGSVDLDPYIVLVPSYAAFGGCWQAFDRFDRNKSRGRVVIPLYAQNTQRAVLFALANYRWETAKLSAGSYWLEKGLTGSFYDLYKKFSLPGTDEQQAFVAAYCQWILDESRGQIKFPAELRRLFWHQIPFEKTRAELLVKYFKQFRDLS